MNEAEKQRVAENEALFRDVNERIEQTDEELQTMEPRQWEFLCECGDATCTTLVSLTLAEYEHVRSSPVYFAVVPGHEIPEIERVVARNDRFAIVEKVGPEARIVRERHPRSKQRR